MNDSGDIQIITLECRDLKSRRQICVISVVDELEVSLSKQIPLLISVQPKNIAIVFEETWKTFSCHVCRMGRLRPDHTGGITVFCVWFVPVVRVVKMPILHHLNTVTFLQYRCFGV